MVSLYAGMVFFCAVMRRFYAEKISFYVRLVSLLACVRRFYATVRGLLFSL
jgi:hypothetical protein